MSSVDELRDLIQQVADAGGPLRIVAGNYVGRYVTYGEGGDRVHPDDLGSDDIQDVLAGVLRRDMASHGMTVTHTIYGPSGSHTVEWEANGIVRESDDALMAHLRCWLDAHERGLVGRQEVEL